MKCLDGRYFNYAVIFVDNTFCRYYTWIKLSMHIKRSRDIRYTSMHRNHSMFAMRYIESIRCFEKLWGIFDIHPWIEITRCLQCDSSNQSDVLKSYEGYSIYIDGSKSLDVCNAIHRINPIFWKVMDYAMYRCTFKKHQINDNQLIS